MQCLYVLTKALRHRCKVKCLSKWYLSGILKLNIFTLHTSLYQFHLYKHALPAIPPLLPPSLPPSQLLVQHTSTVDTLWIDHLR